jgi:hypothetical protein
MSDRLTGDDPGHRAREEAGEALDAFLARTAREHATRARKWNLWGGHLSLAVAILAGVTLAWGLTRPARWADVTGVALVGLACGMLGYWFRVATS